MEGLTVQVTPDGRVLIWRRRGSIELLDVRDTDALLRLLREARDVQAQVWGEAEGHE